MIKLGRSEIGLPKPMAMISMSEELETFSFNINLTMPQRESVKNISFELSRLGMWGRDIVSVVPIRHMEGGGGGVIILVSQ